MNRITKNSGIAVFGDGSRVENTAVGTGAVVYNHSPQPHAEHTPENGGSDWEIGIVTVIPAEATAVRDALGLTAPADQAGPLWFYTGEAEGRSGKVKVVMTRALGQGQRSAMAAFENLRRNYGPRFLALVGIGGGFHDDIAMSDVVISTRVVYYDQRKETPTGSRRRGEEKESPARAGHAANAFFTDHGDPALLMSSGERPGTFRVLHGPIGSGEAVVADGGNEILRFLSDYNDKILAVDMEAGGLSQFSQENSADSGEPPAWVVIRGVSDKADQAKNDDQHATAAHNAAATLREFIRYIA